MTKDEALDMALEFVEANHSGGPDAFELISAIKQARSAPVQEPVAALIDENQRLRAELKFNTLPAQEFVCSTGLCHYKVNKENT